MSDLHAGAETSLISNIVRHRNGAFEVDKLSPSPTTLALSAALRPTLSDLGQGHEKPADLVLLGDVLDLSLSPPDRSAQVFETFAKTLFLGADGRGTPTHLSRQVFFIPGNHDHSLWTALRYQTETYSDGDEKLGRSLRDKGVLSRFEQVTPAFTDPDEKLQSSIIQEILSTATGEAFTVPVYYPNMGRYSDKTDRAVVFHHGHFIEATYRLLSLLVAGFHGRECGPLTVEQLEKENGNWIDFGWSTIGETAPSERTSPRSISSF